MTRLHQLNHSRFQPVELAMQSWGQRGFPFSLPPSLPPSLSPSLPLSLVCVRECVRACVCACVRAHARVCVCVCLHAHARSVVDACVCCCCCCVCVSLYLRLCLREIRNAHARAPQTPNPKPPISADETKNRITLQTQPHISATTTTLADKQTPGLQAARTVEAARGLKEPRIIDLIADGLPHN